MEGLKPAAVNECNGEEGRRYIDKRSEARQGKNVYPRGISLECYNPCDLLLLTCLPAHLSATTNICSYMRDTKDAFAMTSVLPPYFHYFFVSQSFLCVYFFSYYF